MEEIIDRLKKVRRGAMFIIEAPSGTGKSAVVKEILRRDPNIKFSVSVTTRQPREGEVDGVEFDQCGKSGLEKRCGAIETV